MNNKDKAKVIQTAMFVAETKKQVATTNALTNREIIELGKKLRIFAAPLRVLESWRDREPNN